MRPVLVEPVVGVAEVPFRPADLGRHRRDRDQSHGRVAAPAGHDAVQVEPAVQLRGHVEGAVRRPRRLRDPGHRVARHDRGRAQRAVGSDRRDDALRPVPGHVRVAPADPGEAEPVRREARRRDEVRAAGQLDDARRVLRGRAVQRDRHQRVDGLAALDRVVLADADEASPGCVEAGVRVAPAAIRRQRRRGSVGAHAQQPPGREVGDDDKVSDSKVRRPAVLVDARPDVDAGRADVADATLTGPPDQRLATGVLGAALQPRHGGAVPARLGEPDEPGRDQLEGHGRTPAAVRRHRPGRCSVGRDEPVGERSLCHRWLTSRSSMSSYRLPARPSSRRCGGPAPRA